jgi:hypothetical protein
MCNLRLTIFFSCLNVRIVLQRLQKLDIGFVVRAVDDGDLEYSLASAATTGKGANGSRSRAASMHKALSESRPQSPNSPGEISGEPPLAPLAQLSPQVNLRKISLLQRPAKDATSFRSLMVENQLQNVVVEV